MERDVLGRTVLLEREECEISSPGTGGASKGFRGVLAVFGLTVDDEAALDEPATPEDELGRLA